MRRTITITLTVDSGTLPFEESVLRHQTASILAHGVTLLRRLGVAVQQSTATVQEA